MTNTSAIKKRMAELGLSQSALAEKLGVTQPTICLKLNNKRAFTLIEAFVLADILGIDREDFRSYFFGP